MKRIFVFVALSLSALFWSLPASAQRQTPGRPSIEASAVVGPTYGKPYPVSVTGANFTFRQYLRVSNWSVGVDYLMNPYYQFVIPAEYLDDVIVVPEKDYPFLVHDINFLAGYTVRLWAPRSRVVALSLGASISLGARIAPGLDKCQDYKKTYPMEGIAGFIFGMIPEFQFEVFPFRNASFFAAARPRIQFLSTLKGECNWFCMTGAFGMRYYF